MKRIKNILFVFIMILCIFFITTTIIYKDYIKNIKVYSISGENEYIKLDNCILFLKPDEEIIDGGNITYSSTPIENISHYTLIIYTKIDNNENYLLSTSVSVKNNDHAMKIPKELIVNKELGSLKSGTIIPTNKKLSDIKDNLFLTLKLTKTNGEKIDFTVKLKAKEIK
ncbi:MULTISPECIES: hypothetical protein [Clostridium]|uniref:Uncharacterized protein n=1 Tax=Clostridium senegalense TaxID=1465809 RepID=A0A6M0H1F6_9CLOT|nr:MULTISPECIES: hypothetical protein [Clostridium]NEU04585.1 hypothetical protein [Clostridium senegalense]